MTQTNNILGTGETGDNTQTPGLIQKIKVNKIRGGIKIDTSQVLQQIEELENDPVAMKELEDLLNANNKYEDKEELIKDIDNLGNNEIAELFEEHENKHIKHLSQNLSKNDKTTDSKKLNKIKNSLSMLSELEICKLLIAPKDFEVNGKKRFTWNEAMDETKKAGKYVPSIDEWKYIAELCEKEGVKMYEYFASVNSYYWSSTASAIVTTLAWLVNFGNCTAGNGNKTNGYYVRCTR